MLKLKKKKTSALCDVSRCKKKPTEMHDLDVPLYFCTDHAGEARAEYQEEGFEVRTQPYVPSENETLAVVEDEERENLEAELCELEEALELVEAFTIATAEDVAFAEESRALTKGQWKTYEDKRTKATKPLNASLREINSWFKPVQTTLKSIERVWNSKLITARREAEAEKQRLLAAAREAEAPQEIRETLVAASEAPLQTSEVRFRDRWVFEVHDPSLVPRSFLMPDERKIGEAVALLKDKTEIPGVRAWNDPIVSGPSR